MQLKELKKRVYDANISLVEHKLVLFTWGNVSGIDREHGYVVIKPSGVSYDKMTPDDMVVLDTDGNILEGELNPSSDTPTHLVLYNAFESIGAVVHTHSSAATSFAQAGRDIPVYGTTHADSFRNSVRCTRRMREDEVTSEYEKNTGKLIVETIGNDAPEETSAVLIQNHGPFVWGKDPADAVYKSAVLEEIAKTALMTEMLNPDEKTIDRFLADKHYLRKHGAGAYYGQKKNDPPEAD